MTSVLFASSLTVAGALVAAALLTWVERRLLGFLQVRLGPNRVGPFGALQWVADMVKMLFKEDWVPAHAHRAAFVLEIIEQGDLRILGEAELPEGRLGVPYPRTRLEAAPEAPGSTWSVLAGRLPPGVELAPDGTLEGSPGEEGVFAFLVQVRTPSNERRRATRAIRVVDPADASEVAGGGGCRCARADRSPRRSRGGLASSGGLTGGRSGPLVALLIGGLMLTPLAGRRGRRRPGQRGEP